MTIPYGLFSNDLTKMLSDALLGSPGGTDKGQMGQLARSPFKDTLDAIAGKKLSMYHKTYPDVSPAELAHYSPASRNITTHLPMFLGSTSPEGDYTPNPVGRDPREIPLDKLQYAPETALGHEYGHDIFAHHPDGLEFYRQLKLERNTHKPPVYPYEASDTEEQGASAFGDAMQYLRMTDKPPSPLPVDPVQLPAVMNTDRLAPLDSIMPGTRKALQILLDNFPIYKNHPLQHPVQVNPVQPDAQIKPRGGSQFPLR